MELRPATGKTRKEADGREKRRTCERKRLNAVFEPEIGPTHDRRHVSRNKFSGYRVYFRWPRAGDRCYVARSLAGATVIGDVGCGCRCNLCTRAVSGFGAS